MSDVGDRIRTAFDRVHRLATKQTTEPYMSIPVDEERDADCIVLNGIAELERDLRTALDLLQAMLNEDGNGGLDWNEPSLKGTVGWEIRELVKKYKGRLGESDG